MSLPYLYLPEMDFELYAQAMNLFDPDVLCYTDGYCKMNSPCEFIQLKTWYF
jgi:hypothetical protein